jgi:transposase
MASIEDIDPNNIIVIDESGSDLSMTSDYARSEGGERAKAPKPHTTSSKFSIIGAIGITCVVAAMYVQAAVNTEIFETFVRKFLNPKLSHGKYVVMDNVNFHKSDTIINLIESTGARVVFLPPYSPDLSPIEKMWSKIKEILKRSKPRSNAEFHDSLASAFHEINEEDLYGWYEECGYNVSV